MSQQQFVLEIVFETHSISEDNELGLASGWNHSRLSARGRELARELGKRRRDDKIAAVFTSDLYRAVETAQVAFEGTSIPVLHDWRLRECDYGEMNGQPVARVHGNRTRFLEVPYPGGESWRQAIARVARVFEDLPLRWSGRRVLLIGHVATHWACEHDLKGIPLEQLAMEDRTVARGLGVSSSEMRLFLLRWNRAQQPFNRAHAADHSLRSWRLIRPSVRQIMVRGSA